MNPEFTSHYIKIAKAIDFIQQCHTQQPTLDEIAANVNLSPFHFQRLFTEWAGISPKQFLHYISLQYAKNILNNSHSTLSHTTQEVGFSSSSRLHDLFVKIEGMTPGEYKDDGANLLINYHYTTSIFGEILIASTHKGICYMGFYEGSKSNAFAELNARFVKARFKQKHDHLQERALKLYRSDWRNTEEIKCHLKGTDFQLKVWESLLSIPSGQLTTYGNVALAIDKPKASRAVGTAIGKNPVSLLIPCHRVIQQSGMLGGYRWGETRKKAIIGWEACNK